MPDTPKPRKKKAPIARKKKAAPKKKAATRQAEDPAVTAAKRTAATKRKLRKPVKFDAGKVQRDMDAAGKFPEVAQATDKDAGYLRYAALIHYTTDLNGTTAEKMRKHPIFRGLAPSTLENWRHADNWVERRKQILEKWRKQIEVAVGDRLVQSRMAALGRVTAIRDKLLLRLEKGDAFDDLAPDKAVTSLVKLMQIEWEMSEVVLSAVMPSALAGQAAAQSDYAPVAQLTHNEHRVAARAILAERRASIVTESTNNEPA